MRRAYTRQQLEPRIDRTATDSDPDAVTHQDSGVILCERNIKHLDSTIERLDSTTTLPNKAAKDSWRRAQTQLIEYNSMVEEREELEEQNHDLTRRCQELEAHCEEQQEKLHLLEHELATVVAQQARQLKVAIAEAAQRAQEEALRKSASDLDRIKEVVKGFIHLDVHAESELREQMKKLQDSLKTAKLQSASGRMESVVMQAKYQKLQAEVVQMAADRDAAVQAGFSLNEELEQVRELMRTNSCGAGSRHDSILENMWEHMKTSTISSQKRGSLSSLSLMLPLHQNSSLSPRSGSDDELEACKSLSTASEATIKIRKSLTVLRELEESSRSSSALTSARTDASAKLARRVSNSSDLTLLRSPGREAHEPHRTLLQRCQELEARCEEQQEKLRLLDGELANALAQQAVPREAPRAAETSRPATPTSDGASEPQSPGVFRLCSEPDAPLTPRDGKDELSWGIEEVYAKLEAPSRPEPEEESRPADEPESPPADSPLEVLCWRCSGQIAGEAGGTPLEVLRHSLVERSRSGSCEAKCRCKDASTETVVEDDRTTTCSGDSRLAPSRTSELTSSMSSLERGSGTPPSSPSKWKPAAAAAAGTAAVAAAPADPAEGPSIFSAVWSMMGLQPEKQEPPCPPTPPEDFSQGTDDEKKKELWDWLNALEAEAHDLRLMQARAFE